MNMTILMVVLAVVSNSAMAEWVRVGVINETIFYFDPASILKHDDRASLWQLSNFGHTETTGIATYLSSKSQIEFDCKESLVRRLTYSLYAKNMGKGHVINTNSDIQEWRPVSRGSSMEFYFDRACGKK
jgi:hypothetical protein